MNTTARTLRSSVSVAGAGLLLAATGVALAPAATADSGLPALAVSTAAPAEIGLAGQPVGFTTTASNVGKNDTSSTRLIYHIDGGGGLPPNALSLQYRLSGTAWKTVPLKMSDLKFFGELPETFPLAAGQSRTVQLRIGLPMGTPHNGDSNGGTDHLKLTTMISYGAAGAANDVDEDTVKVGALSTSLSGVPATAVVGGPGVTFRATVSNPTPSAYENVTDVLYTNRHTTVQVLRSGAWKTLKPITSNAEPDLYGFDVIGKDASMAAHSSTSVKVRVAYRKGAALGKTDVAPCAIVNEGSIPFRGSTFCGESASIKLTAAASGRPTPTASAKPSAKPSATASAPAGTGTHTPTASVTPSTTTTAPADTRTHTGTDTQLASTGSSGVSAIAVAAAALVAAGAGALGFAALRRRRARG
ncbi:hypothetical protein [Streptomyces brevispora]|uniref:LPXTG-motif cell wall-anchored protein n=1 Tax=Streptomyces brevispora TaxID=887462 RepID=A0ABZ1G6W8_9ACTN|nr:hypothetical protein [Streptomyces brevispora]WSC15540.1 hypothetical protein OIE64_23700 [Streptomyces brevispora]